jgi:formylglycine-generating enzyme required for sulfatase activity
MTWGSMRRLFMETCAMDFNEKNYIIIPAGDYVVGLDLHQLESIYAWLNDPTVRREFLSASYPAHTIRLERVLIRKSLVTRDEFSAFAAETGHVTDAEKDGWGWISKDGQWRKQEGLNWRNPLGDEEYSEGDDAGAMPVMQASWNDASAYCAWLAGRGGRPVRMPYEREWEVFAGMTGVAGAGERASVGDAGAIVTDFIATVKIAMSNEWNNSTGLLWEWTEDWYDRYPGGPDQKDFGRVYKVLRGGSAVSLPIQRCREFRLRKCPTARSPYYGFRVALPVLP